MNFDSVPGRQAAQLFEIPNEGRPKLVAQRAFVDLAPGQEIRVSYFRSWDAESPAEGNYPPSYKLILSYDLDIGNDGIPENDDTNSQNNELIRSGSRINALFGSPTPRPPANEGSNSQDNLPRNLYLADVNGDGRTDFLQRAGTRIFAYETDFDKTGILHEYVSSPVRRLVTGDFLGAGYDQTVALTTSGKLLAFQTGTEAGSTRSELRDWFQQDAFFSTLSDTIVADYNGDGRSDILVYNRSSGDMRFYTLDAGSNSRFVSMPGFSIGNLERAERAGTKIRAGDVDGDSRADIVTVNSSGQVSYFHSVWTGSQDTFWWAWTSAGGFVSSDDQIQLARIDDNLGQDLVLHNSSTGETRFHKMQFGNGRPPVLPVTTGQIQEHSNSSIYFANFKDPRPEPGGTLREDSISFYSNGNRYRRVDARWDGTSPTYWWAYTQNTPRNDTGWADVENHKWLVIKCKMADRSAEPNSDDFYRQLYTSASDDGVVEYWRDISYGTYDLSANEVDDNWYVMDEKYDELVATFLFSTDTLSQTAIRNVIRALDNTSDESVPSALEKEFDTNDNTLSAEAEVEVRTAGSEWRIRDGGKTFIVKSEDNTLKIYKPVSRWEKIKACIDASGRSTNNYTGVIAVVNSRIDAGYHNQVLVDPGAMNVTFAAHEMAHGYGWKHSFDDTDRQNATWSQPGEYFDHWDIMSAMAVRTFKNSQGLTSGPEMNAPYKMKKAFIPQHRIHSLTSPATEITPATYNIAAINRPEANGLLMLRIGGNDDNYYTVEFRQKSGWDRGIDKDAVLVHQVWSGIDGKGNRVNERSILLTENGRNADRQPGDVVYLPTGVAIKIESFDARAQTAQVTILPAQPIYSSGVFTVRGTWSGDLDQGSEATSSIEADFHWAQKTSTTRELVPRNGAQFAVMGTSPLGYHQCLAAPLSSSPIQANGSTFGDLAVGNWICGRTSEGRITAFKVVSITPRPAANNDITLEFFTWEN